MTACLLFSYKPVFAEDQNNSLTDTTTESTAAVTTTSNSTTTVTTTPKSTTTVTTTTVTKVPVTVVSYTARSVRKGALATPIWDQHKIWSNKSSAANHGCGVVCTAMALNLSGRSTTPNTTLKQMGRSIKKCAPVLTKDVVACCKKNKVKAVAYNAYSYSQNKNIAIMKQALNQGKVVMAYVKGAPFSSSTHWILLTGYSKSGQILVANSSYGKNSICRKTGKQYHVVTWNTIKSRLIHKKVKYCGFVVIG